MEKPDIKQRTFQFSIKLLRALETLPRGIGTESMVKQLVRSATSIGANVVEGQGGSSKKDFLNFLVIARKSAYETQYWLELLRTLQPFHHASELLTECDIIIRILSRIILTLQGK